MSEKLTEKIVQNHLFAWRLKQGHQFITPNVMLAYGEADLLSLTKSDFVYEYEIKLTKSDFKADRKKWLKHNHYQNKPFSSRYGYIPNYFFYVMPENLVDKAEIPNHAGLIYFSIVTQSWGELWVFQTVKKAVKLHDKIADENFKQKLGYSMMFKFWNLRRKVEV